MEAKERVSVKGLIHIILKDSTGKIKAEIKQNLILNTGKEMFADLIGGTGGQTILSAIALGDNGTAPDATQTDLIGTQVANQTTTNQRIETTERFVATFTFTASATIQEAVLHDNASPRKCACRATFGPITVAVDDVLTFTWDINFA
jgi:hypothetical protein